MSIKELIFRLQGIGDSIGYDKHVSVVRFERAEYDYHQENLRMSQCWEMKVEKGEEGRGAEIWIEG